MARRSSDRRGLRLRARIVAMFSLGALLLSVLLATSTYGVARQNLLRQRERNAVDQATANALLVQSGLARSEEDDSAVLVSEILEALSTPAGGAPLLNVGPEAEDWRGGGQVSQGDLPDAVRQRVIVDRVAARQRYAAAGSTWLAVGVPFPRPDVAYFEVTPLDELEDALRLLAITLAISGVVTTLGGAAFGVWAARRVLRPIGDISLAATAIAGGRLDTRLQEVDDPDLASLVNSFNGMATALQDRIDRDTRFASDVSHELRSPLMTLRASVEVLESRKEAMPERSQEALELLTTDLDRFERLMEDLLEISRIDTGSLSVSVEELAPAGLVEAVLNSRRETVPVVISPDLEGVTVLADKRRLAQVLSNLLDNAAFYAGGATRILVLSEADEVQLVIEDAGPGIPEEERELVFERFARGSTAGQRGAGRGTGLGLALVREHTRLMGGRVWVSSRADDQPGSRFVVALPAVRE